LCILEPEKLVHMRQQRLYRFGEFAEK
jgi:hypothetical protein